MRSILLSISAGLVLYFALDLFEFGSIEGRVVLVVALAICIFFVFLRLNNPRTCPFWLIVPTVLAVVAYLIESQTQVNNVSVLTESISVLSENKSELEKELRIARQTVTLLQSYGSLHNIDEIMETLQEIETAIETNSGVLPDEDVFRFSNMLAEDELEYLCAALEEASRPYIDAPNKEDDYFGEFVDNGRSYDKISVTFAEAKRAGFVRWEMSGRVVQRNQMSSFPIVSNNQLPHEINDYISIVDNAVAGEDSLISFNAIPMIAGCRSYHYLVSYPEFSGRFDYRREYCHPTSQGLDPDAFVLFLDMVESPIEELEITLLFDQKVSNVDLYWPKNKDADISGSECYEWDQGVESYRIDLLSPEDLIQYNLMSAQRGVEFVEGYHTKIFRPKSRRIFVIYYRGEVSSSTEFLKEAG